MKTYRLFRDGAHSVYRIRVAQRAVPGGGADLEVSSILFEDLLTGEIFTVPARGIWHVEQLETEQMQELLRRALAQPR